MSRDAPNRHEKGGKKYKDWIAKDTKRSDTYGNLPFQFIKPPKRFQARREIYYICLTCGTVNLVNKNTIGTTCSGCKQYNRVEESPNFSSEEELEKYLENLNEPSEGSL